MRQAVFLAGFVALANASPALQAIDFASVNAAPAPLLTGPPASVNTHIVPYNSALVAASGSAAAHGVAAASATASQSSNSKRTFIWGWPLGGLSPSKPQPTPSPTTTASQISTTSATTSSTSACATTPEDGTYCGFINPEDPCAPQPDGYGTHVVPDNPEAFEDFPEFHTTAQFAKAPAGYVATFRDLNATVNANTYLGLTTLKSYNVSGCASLCDNTELCTAFNIYFERDPSLNPTHECPNPASITNMKCTLWGSGVNKESAVNHGQTRNQFIVVIAGSDGFEKTNITTPDNCAGWQPPKQCGGDGSKAHHHASTCIGTRFFTGPFNPALCAAYAQAQNAENAKSSLWQNWFSLFSGKDYNPGKCNFFNSYMLKKNGKGLGTYCGLYAQQYDGAAATYLPGWQGSDFWSIESSWSYNIQS